MKKSIFLCGFMGVGKSTVGKCLATKLAKPFYDTDQMITESAGATVAELFANGEESFRQYETKEILKFESLPAGVVALGGGALKDPVNLRSIQKSGVLVYLGAEPSTLYARIGDSNTRPLLADHTGEARLKKIEELLKAREVIYKSADITIKTDGKTPEKVCEDIITELKRGHLE